MAEKVIRYKADKPGDFRPHEDGSGSFSSFAVSSQMRKPLVRAGHDIVAIAKTIVPPSGDPRNGHYNDHFAVHSTYDLKLKTGPRAVAEVTNDYWTAPALEFGSGDPSIGDSAGEERPQGGWNKPKRPLGKAGGMIGDWHE
jgi:hypothetical protein